MATRETTGDLATRRGAGDPEKRAEWTTVSRYGHLRSAPVVVDVGVRTEWEPPTLRAALWLSTRPTWAPPRWLTASPTSRERVCRVVAVQDIAMRSLLLQALAPDPEVRERCRVRRLPFVYSPSGCAGQCGLLFHSCCDSRRFMVFSRPRGLWASMRYPVLSGSPLRADLYTTTIATIWWS